MSKLDGYEYPDIPVTQAIEIVRLIEEENIETLQVLANALGHKGPTAWRGGGFRSKMAALGKYGLLAGRPSDLQLSEIAKSIVHPRNDEERSSAISRAVLTVPLLAKLHEKLDGRVPRELWMPLYDITKTDQKIVKKHADTIRRIYMDAIPYLQSRTETYPREGPRKEDEGIKELPPGTLRFMTEDINITVPKSDANIDYLRNLLESLKESPDQKKD